MSQNGINWIFLPGDHIKQRTTGLFLEVMKTEMCGVIPAYFLKEMVSGKAQTFTQAWVEHHCSLFFRPDPVKVFQKTYSRAGESLEDTISRLIPTKSEHICLHSFKSSNAVPGKTKWCSKCDHRE